MLSPSARSRIVRRHICQRCRLAEWLDTRTARCITVQGLLTRDPEIKRPFVDNQLGDVKIPRLNMGFYSTVSFGTQNLRGAGIIFCCKLANWCCVAVHRFELKGSSMLVFPSEVEAAAACAFLRLPGEPGTVRFKFCTKHKGLSSVGLCIEYTVGGVAGFHPVSMFKVEHPCGSCAITLIAAWTKHMYQSGE